MAEGDRRVLTQMGSGTFEWERSVSLERSRRRASCCGQLLMAETQEGIYIQLALTRTQTFDVLEDGGDDGDGETRKDLLCVLWSTTVGNDEDG